MKDPAETGGPVEFPLTATQKKDFQFIPPWLSEVALRFIDHQFQVFLVGGAVRDLLWGSIPNDWDLATDAPPEQIESLFPKTIATGKQFGAITVMAGENPVEITTLRSDLGYSDGRRPDAIRFERNIVPDLARRDFTINAIAYDFSRDILIDPFGGRRDIRRRILRAVGDPAARFAEDGLRMFRFYRFIATLSLKPHRPTEKAIRPEWAKTLSMERIRDEFGKLLVGTQVRPGLKGLSDSGLLEGFLPELAEYARGCHHYPGLWEHLLAATETIEPRLELRLAALLHDIAKPVTRTEDKSGVHFYGHDELGAAISEKILKRLRFPGKLVASVTNLIRRHMFAIPYEAGDGAIRRFIAKAGPEAVPDLLELRRADIVASGRINGRTFEVWQELKDRINHVLRSEFGDSRIKPVVNGHDLIDQFVLPPGPLIGKLLEYLNGLILDDPALNQKETLLAKAREYLEINRN